MEYIPPARRDVLKAAAASGVLLGTSIGASGTAAAQNDDHPNYLLVFGDGTVTEYEFSVSGANSVEKTTDPGETSIDPELVTINTSDTIESTTSSPTGRPVTVVSGRTTNQADAYHFAGDPSGINFRTDQDNVVVFLNGKRRNPQFVGHDPWFGDFVLFFGDGTPGTYEFTATGRVEKVTYRMGAPVDPDDVTLNIQIPSHTTTAHGRSRDVRPIRRMPTRLRGRSRRLRPIRRY